MCVFAFAAVTVIWCDMVMESAAEIGFAAVAN
jgi:hypothetical protein